MMPAADGVFRRRSSARRAHRRRDAGGAGGLDGDRRTAFRFSEAVRIIAS